MRAVTHSVLPGHRHTPVAPVQPPLALAAAVQEWHRLPASAQVVASAEGPSSSRYSSSRESRQDNRRDGGWDTDRRGGWGGRGGRGGVTFSRDGSGRGGSGRAGEYDRRDRSGGDSGSGREGWRGGRGGGGRGDRWQGDSRQGGWQQRSSAAGSDPRPRDRRDYGDRDDDENYEPEDGWDEDQGSDGEDRPSSSRSGRGRGSGARGWDGAGAADAGSGGGSDLTRAELVGEALYGVFPVLNALRSSRRKLFDLYVLSTLDLSARKDSGSVRALLAAADSAGVKVHKVSRHELNLLSDYRQHQGFVLDCETLKSQTLDSFPAASSVVAANQPPPVWLALDEVMDPQNLGAILRSAWCLGATGVLTSAKNCAPLSPAVSKASAGAMELATVHATKTMQRTLQDAVSKGWQVLGAAGESGAVDSTTVSVDKPTILVVGNEGYGLRTNIRRACSALVKVHMGQGFKPTTTTTTTAAATTTTEPTQAVESPTEPSTAEPTTSTTTASPRPRAPSQTQGGVDSLNVSVATGVLLHDLLTAARRQAAARH